VTVGQKLIELPPLPPNSSPLLSDGRAPLRAEVSEDGPFEVAGIVPPALDGLLLMLGPNPIVVADPEGYRAGEGEGMLHRVAIDDGQPVAMSSRFVRSRALVDRWGAAAPPGPLPMGGLLANRSLVHVAGRLLALDGGGYGYRVTPNLGTAVVEDFETMLTTTMGSCVVVDPSTGAGTFLGLARHRGGGLHLYELSADGMITRSTALPLSFVPDDPPIEVLDDLVAIALSSHDLRWETEERLGDPVLTFDPERPAAIGLLPRGGAAHDMRWCTSGPGAFSAFVCMIASGTGADGVVLHQEAPPANLSPWLPDRRGGVMTGFTADARTQTLRLSPLDDVNVLGIAIDPIATPDARRYAYGVSDDHRTLLKYNVRNSTATRTSLPSHLDAGCPIFWRDPEGRSDEEGWLIVPCFDRMTQRSALVIFDATRTTAEPEAVIGLPSRIPLDARGFFLPGRALG
jgi:carotenoid cleavage dioxygenase